MKLGRLPRRHNPRVPHLSSLLAGRRLPPPPPSIDYTQALPADLGAMGNDRLGDCTCAAVYHAFQVWSANANPPMVTEPDADVISLYTQACGYNPADPSTDQGGVEQDVLTYCVLSGAPAGPDGSQRLRLAAFVEIDPRNRADVQLAIADCGVAYIGFEVPDYIMAGATVWDVAPSANYEIVGGHAVVLAGYDPDGLDVISWGKQYRMTWAFFQAFTDEAYALAYAGWIRATGTSPAGLSLADLESQMQGLREESG